MYLLCQRHKVNASIVSNVETMISTVRRVIKGATIRAWWSASLSRLRACKFAAALPPIREWRHLASSNRRHALAGYQLVITDRVHWPAIGASDAGFEALKAGVRSVYGRRLDSASETPSIAWTRTLLYGETFAELVKLAVFVPLDELLH